MKTKTKLPIIIPDGYMIASVKTHQRVTDREWENALRDLERGDYRKYGIMRADRDVMTQREAASIASWLESIKQ